MTDLFQYADSRPPNYRPSDPITSRDAGRSAHSFTAEHHQAILNVLRRAGRPMACEEISDALRFDYERGKASLALDYVAVGKRMKELSTTGLIEKTAEIHTNRSGRGAFRHRLKRQPDEVASSTG